MSTFEAKKQRLLQQLAVPSETYSDASPKGAIDEEISELVYEVNALDGFVTTSSCAGRIAVYLEGPPQSHSADAHSGHARDGEPITQPSTGKGGGRWLYVSHLPLDLEANSGRGCLLSLVGLPVGAQVSVPDGSQERRLIHFKFEPMILHVLTSTLPHARQILSAALTAGFRESGISSISSQDDTVMTALRSSGLAFDCIIGFANVSGALFPMVSEDYIAALVRLANERFVVNAERKERFRRALLSSVMNHVICTERNEATWEPAEQRRDRKRAEGLRRRDEIREQAEALRHQDRASHDAAEVDAVLPLD